MEHQWSNHPSGLLYLRVIRNGQIQYQVNETWLTEAEFEQLVGAIPRMPARADCGLGPQDFRLFPPDNSAQTTYTTLSGPGPQDFRLFPRAQTTEANADNVTGSFGDEASLHYEHGPRNAGEQGRHDPARTTCTYTDSQGRPIYPATSAVRRTSTATSGGQHVSYQPQLTPLAQAFAQLEIGDFNGLGRFVLKNRGILAQPEIDNLLSEAVYAQRAGKEALAQKYVHHAVLLQKCSKCRPEALEPLFQNLATKGETTKDLFADVKKAHKSIKSQYAAPEPRRPERVAQDKATAIPVIHEPSEPVRVITSEQSILHHSPSPRDEQHQAPSSLFPHYERHQARSPSSTSQRVRQTAYERYHSPRQRVGPRASYEQQHSSSQRAGRHHSPRLYVGEYRILRPEGHPHSERQRRERAGNSFSRSYPETGEVDSPPGNGEEFARHDRIVMRRPPSRTRRRLSALHGQKDPQEASACGMDMKDQFPLLHHKDDRDTEDPKVKLFPGSTSSPCSLTTASAQEPERDARLLPSDRLKENYGAESDITDVEKHVKLLQEDIKTKGANTERSRLQLYQKEETSSDKQDHDDDKEAYLEVNRNQGKAGHAGGMTGSLKTYSEHQLPVRSKSDEHTTSWSSRPQADECGEEDPGPNLVEAEESTQCLASTDGSPPTSDREVSFSASAGSEDYTEPGGDGLAQKLHDLQSEIARRFVHQYSLERGPSMRSPGLDSTTRTQKRATYQAQGACARVDPADSGRRSKRGRSNHSDGDGDGEDEDHRKRSGHQPSRNSGSENSSHELFACPYSKYDPDRYSERNHNPAEKSYRGCSSSFLRDISRVKQHLYRVHKRPDHYCGSCFHVFETQVALDAHTRQRPVCENFNIPFSEKMTVDQSNSVKRRRYGKDARETWFNIYAILFPNSPLPASPYCEAASSTVVLSFSQRFRTEAPSMLSTLVRNRIQDFIPLEQCEQQILDNALEEALSEVILQFGSDFEATELSTTGPSANSQSSDLSSLATSKDSQSISDHCLSVQIANHQNPTIMQSTSSSSAHLKTRGHLFPSYGSPTENDIPETALPSPPIPESISQDLRGTNIHSSACSGTRTANCHRTYMSAGKKIFGRQTPKQFARNPTSRANVVAMSQNPQLKTMAQNAYAANANTWLWSGPPTDHGIDVSYNNGIYTAPQSDLSEMVEQSSNFWVSSANFDLDLFETLTNSDALVEQPL